MKKLYVLLDNGHGKNTPGKHSPILEDGTRFYEWEWCRHIVDSMYERLKDSPIYVPIKITPETIDIILSERVRRINQYCKKYGAKNCIMISVHVNAAGNGGWMSGRGWSAWTTRGQNVSDNLAECLYDGASLIINQNKDYIDSFKGEKMQKPIRIEKSDKDRDYEANYAIIKGSNCAAVLTENFFMDNKKDLAYLMGALSMNDVVALHIRGIELYYERYIK